MNESIEKMIHVIRGHRVMLDADLAMLYDVPTKRLNEQLRRNKDRFPEDFAFQLSQNEWDSLRSQIATLDNKSDNSLKSQIVTSSLSGRGKHTKYLPCAFTEHGVIMLANVLHSSHAIEMSIKVVRAFIQLKNSLVIHEKFSKELLELKSFMLKHSHTTDREFRRVWQAIEKLSTPPPVQRRIGFDLSQ